MDNLEFARRLAQVQDELDTLYGYLAHNSVLDEREDYVLLGLIRAALSVTVCFNESIRAITRSIH